MDIEGRATSLTDFPCSMSWRATVRWSGRSLGGRPNATPRAWAARRPSSVRSAISERSNSAMPANTVSTMRPAGVVVSAQGSVMGVIGRFVRRITVPVDAGDAGRPRARVVDRR